MTETKSTRGGRRNPPGGRPPKPEGEKMKNATFRLTPDNLAFLQTVQPGKRGELINRLLDWERKKSEPADEHGLTEHDYYTGLTREG